MTREERLRELRRKQLMLKQQALREPPSGGRQSKDWRTTLWENVVGDDDPTTQNFGEHMGSFLNKMGESATFGLVGDEAGAAADAALGRGSYDERLNHYRGQEELFERENPGAALTADVGGALVAPLGAIGALGRGASLPARMGASAAATGGLSAIYGGLEGEGGLNNRLREAQGAGQTGAAIGAAIPVVGGAAQRVANNRAFNRTVRETAENAPTTDQLRQQARASYRAVDDAGVQIRPQSFNRLADEATQAMAESGMDQLPGPGSLTPNSARVGQIMREMGGEMASEPTAALPFSSLDQLRRHAGTAAGNMANRTDSAAGMAAISSIDDFVQRLTPDDVTGGDVDALKAAITKARDTYARSARSQTIDDAIGASENYLSGGSSGIRNQFKRILNNPKLSRGYSEAEKRMMRRVINGSMPEQLLHLLGGGLGQLGTIGAGLGLGGLPGAVAGMAIGAGARRGSESLSRRSAEQARAVIANGGLPNAVEATPLARLLTEQLLLRGTAAGPQ